MDKIPPDTTLGIRFAKALELAVELHSHQSRKINRVPYLSHLLIVAGTVLENGGGEDEAIAALLHDAAEDQGGRPTLERIRAQFGDKVAEIVESCSDAFDEPKPEWRSRKEKYIAHLAVASNSVRLVAGADKLHNLSCTLKDLRANPDASYWDSFNARASEQAWYYRKCGEALAGGEESALTREFDRVFKEFSAILRERGDL